MSFGEAGCDLRAVWCRYRRSSCFGIALSGHPLRGGVAWWGNGKGSGNRCVLAVHIMLGIVQLVRDRSEVIQKLFGTLRLWLAVDVWSFVPRARARVPEPIGCLQIGLHLSLISQA